MIQAILFDLDGTLLDRDSGIEPFLVEQCKRYSLNHLPFEKYLHRFIELDEHGYVDKEKVYQELGAEFEIPLTAEELAADFRLNSGKHCKPFPGAMELLEHLRSRWYKLGIITNGYGESQRAKLVEFGLLDRVDEALISGEEQLRKPDKRIFKLAADRLGVTAAECVFVGDNPEADIFGAHQSGMKTIWFKGFLPWPECLAIVPDHTVNTLPELLSIEL